MTEKSAGKTNNTLRIWVVYIVILAIAVYQVLFAMMAGPQPVLMLAVAALQAALAGMYFMHMKEERHSLFLALIPYTVFVLFMMNMIWSDSGRLLRMRPH